MIDPVGGVGASEPAYERPQYRDPSVEFKKAVDDYRTTPSINNQSLVHEKILELPKEKQVLIQSFTETIKKREKISH